MGQVLLAEQGTKPCPDCGSLVCALNDDTFCMTLRIDRLATPDAPRIRWIQNVNPCEHCGSRVCAMNNRKRCLTTRTVRGVKFTPATIEQPEPQDEDDSTPVSEIPDEETLNAAAKAEVDKLTERITRETPKPIRKLKRR